MRCLIFFAAVALTGQTFDAASVKVGSPDFVPGVSVPSRGGPGTSDPGRITYSWMGLKLLLTKAWDVPMDQITGPAWLDMGGDTYTITATMPPNTTREEFQQMLQNLLIERLRIKLHHETRDFPGYELTVAPGGAKLKPTTQDPNAVAPERDPRVFPKRNPDGSIVLAPGPQVAFSWGTGTARDQFQAQGITRLVSRLGEMMNRSLGKDRTAVIPRVIDKTGLAGKYDFTVEYDCQGCQGLTPAMLANMPLLAGRGGPEPPQPEGAPDPGSGLPNIFVALEKQLGLKLTKIKDVPVDMIVIDSLEKVPLEN